MNDVSTISTDAIQHQTPATGASQAELVATRPGQLRVIKRNNTIVPYDESKIAVAITKAFLAVEGGNAAASRRIHDIVQEMAGKISAAFQRRMRDGGTIHIEELQDQVELGLMREGHHKVARSYVLYREERRKLREQEKAKVTTSETSKGHVGKDDSTGINIILDDGARVPLLMSELTAMCGHACKNLKDVNPQHIIDDTIRNLYDGAPWRDVQKALVMTARTYIEKDPNYSYVAARLQENILQQEAFAFLELPYSHAVDAQANLYVDSFAVYIEKAIELTLLDPRLREYDLQRLAKEIMPERDLQFTYLSMQTLYDRYFIHWQQTRFELPQAFFMRVAMGLALNETGDKHERAVEFYRLLSSFDYMSSTPTLFNSATLRPQLSSCYLSTVPDDLELIFGAIRDNALLSKFAGGLGNDWTPVRAMGAHIKGTNGSSLGVVPFLNVADATAIAVNQGGKRKGALCSYLETWHKDIEEFLDLRKNTGDDRRRTHDMNTANWIPDLFMKRVVEQGEWTLFSPNDVPDLHDLYGLAFEKAYVRYEAKAKAGEIKNSSTIPATSLWRKMLTMLFETGHPWVTFKDPCNIRSPQQHTGVVHSSNLCTEITLNTSIDEIAVCNLGSVNLPAHIVNGKLDVAKLEKTINTAIRMLDNVIDYNYYAVPQARRSNLKHRPIGLGTMGFQDALHIMNIAYASDAAVDFADETMEQVSYFALKASAELAKERGAYPSFEGSLWSQGILPIDSIQKLKAERGTEYLDMDETQRLDWDSIRAMIRTHGIRNSNVLAIAPTATIANICGVSPSIEPTYQNLYVKSNLSGEFTVVNPYLVEKLKSLKLWDEVMVNDLKYFDGSVQKIDRIPDEVKAMYATAFEIDPSWLIDAGSRRQKWLDQAQSLNLYVAQASGKKLDTVYKHAWKRGLKTTYYLRTLGATNAEKSTITDGKLNAVSADMSSSAKLCAIDDPDCEACQ